jgi:hypothetical protein
MVPTRGCEGQGPMASDDRAAGDRQPQAASPRSRLFAVRLWTAEAAGGSEYRGSVRDVVSGAFRGFRTWSDLTAFMIARIEEDERARTGRAKGDTEWSSEGRR